MPQPETDDSSHRRRNRIIAGAVFVAALAMIMGLPALRGEFVGGDDHRLVLNHVLVNQPTLKHAVELFTIVHRDLYQPIPLLTFQFEFVIANAFGLFEESVTQGAWLFHFDNMWLHALNALMVGAVLLSLQRNRSDSKENGDNGASVVVFLAAVVFAVHPLQVEVVAWINGRMMLLSTLFLLAAMLALSRWLKNGRPAHGALCILFTLLSVISKVRAGLPILLAIVPLAQGKKLGKRFWGVWIPCAVIVAAFVVLNVWATSEAKLFSGGEERLRGPSLVRVLLALDFYFEHMVWPVGLSSYYPTPTDVHWADPATIRAMVVVGAVFAFLAVVSFKSPACRWGSLWFLAGIGDTLPFVPARNVLAADRYMYLPIIGLAWIVGTLLYRLAVHLRVRESKPLAVVGTAAGLALIGTWIGVCWRVAVGYTTALEKTKRTAELYPDEPRVWERLGWVYERAGEYDKAIEAAKRELVHEHVDVRSGAYELMGVSYFDRGEVEKGISLLEKAVETDPRSGSAKYQLGWALEKTGELERAAALYEEAVERAPQNNPTLRRLAITYRKLDRLQDARRAYEKVLENNPYDVEAVLGLTELDIEEATNSAYEDAERRLEALLVEVRSEPRLESNLSMVRFLRNQADDTLRLASRAFVALSSGRYEVAKERVAQLAERGAQSAEARRWLLKSLERFDADRPGDPWTYGLTTRLLIAEGQLDAARAFLGLFERSCRSEACRSYAGDLQNALSGSM